MLLRAVIFDLDGTLLDSMGFWEDLAPAFLRRHGVRDFVGISEEIARMTLPEALAHVVKRCSLPLTVAEALAEIERELASFYGERACFKPGAAEFLGEVRRRGCAAGILSATPREYVERALLRLGVRENFSAIRCSGEPGMSKSRPDGFLRLAAELGSRVAETLVCEDAFYAASAAKRAGFRVCAIRDDSEERREELRRIADWYIGSWHEVPPALFA